MNNPQLESIIENARQAYDSGDYAAAIEGFKEAVRFAQASGDELIAAEMSNNLSVTYLQIKQPDQALQAAIGTDQIFEAHSDFAKQGMALGNIGSAYEDRGDLDQAVDYYQRSIELLDQAGENEFRSMVQKSLAAIQIRKGEYLAGLISMQKSLDGKKNLAPREKWLKKLLKLPFKFLGK